MRDQSVGGVYKARGRFCQSECASQTEVGLARHSLVANELFLPTTWIHVVASLDMSCSVVARGDFYIESRSGRAPLSLWFVGVEGLGAEHKWPIAPFVTF